MMYTRGYIDVPSPDTLVNEKIKDYPTTYPPAGSSVRDIDEILDLIYGRIKRGTAIIYPNMQDLLDVDLSSIRPHFEIKNETSSFQENVEKAVSLPLLEEQIVMEMINHDIITALPPKRSYKVELKVRNIRKRKIKIFKSDKF